MNLKLYTILPNGQGSPRDVTSDRDCMRHIVALFIQDVATNLSGGIPSVDWAGLIHLQKKIYHVRKKNVRLNKRIDVLR